MNAEGQCLNCIGYPCEGCEQKQVEQEQDESEQLELVVCQK